MAKIVISEFMDEVFVDRLRADHEVLYDPTLADRPGELLTAVADARALVVRNRTQVDAQLVGSANLLMTVGRLGVGLDNIDLDACARRGISVHPTPGANAVSVAEFVMGGVLVLMRRAFGGSGRLMAGEWPRRELMGFELTGKQIGLVGFGLIAREVASRAKAFGMEVAAYDPYLGARDPAWESARWSTFEDLLMTSDVLSLHVPLRADTRNMIGAEALASMKPGAILINTARGGILDEEALAGALRSGHLSGALLDVFSSEPLDEATRSIFDGVPNLLLTPHIAGVTIESNARISAMTTEHVLSVLARR